MATFGDRFPVRGFLASMGLPQDDAEFFVSCVRRMSGATAASPTDVEQMMGGMDRDRRRTGTTCSPSRREHPLDPEVDFVTHMSRAKLNDDPMPDDDIVDIMVTLTLGSLDTLKSQLGW